jgi:hypothetical protein
VTSGAAANDNRSGRDAKATDLFQDATKQMITLSTGFIALTITFTKDIIGADHGQTAILGIAWVSFILSVMTGVLVLMLMAGNLGLRGRSTALMPRTVWISNVQALFFVLGLVLGVAYGITSLY